MKVIEEIDELQKNIKLMYSSEYVNSAITNVARELNLKFKNEDPIVVCVLKGALPFTGQLLTKLTFNFQVDTLYITSYNGGEIRGALKWVVKPSMDFVGRTIILVEDIIDSGLTLATLVKFYKENGAKNIYTVVLMDKINARHKEGLPSADFVGITISKNVFLVGYGLDYKEYLRNLPGIYTKEKNV